MRFPRLPIFLASLLSVSFLASAAELPHWIVAEKVWALNHGPGAVQHTFRVDRAIKSAELRGVADYCQIKVRINGNLVAETDFLDPLFRDDVTDSIRAGVNRIEIKALASAEGPSAFFAQVKVDYADGGSTMINTTPDWTGGASLGAINPDYWDLEGKGIQVDVFADYEQWQDAKSLGESTAASKFQIPEGFEIERLRSAGKDEDSWIAMAFDPKGRLIISRERQGGLLRMTLPENNGGEMKVEVINEDIAEIRGILWAHDALYVNSNSHNVRKEPRDRTGGLYRLRDTNGDDQFDQVELLGERTATGGHGRNDLTLGPDGMIYLIGGDSVGLPKKFKDLTPRVVKFLPGDDRNHGHVMRTDKDGKNWELVCKGLRNPYGIDFNPDGEMFTYDADAEHDMGSPWYRPTHVRHLVQGADYHWRAVTGQWPPYFCDHADNPPTTLVIGKGSPTSVKFGTRSSFPYRYKKALFVQDWTYGRIFAVHMTPRGASYACKAEPFLQGRPANVTDLDFGPDGAMYFVTGGRGTQSGLYRVKWAGGVTTERGPRAHAKSRERSAADSRARRRKIEEIQNQPGPTSGPGIRVQRTEGDLRDSNSNDPWLRHAARNAFEQMAFDGVVRDVRQLESMKLESFYLANSMIDGLLAQVRWVPNVALPMFPIEESASNLNAIPLRRLSANRLLAALRAYEIILLRSPNLEPNVESMIRAKLLSLFPSKSDPVNRQLASLLIRLGAADAVPRTMKLMEAATDQHEQFHYLFHLRDARNGWTDELRERYFIALRQAVAEYRGGRGLPGFLKQVREDALAAIPNPDARARYAALGESGKESKLNYADLIAGRKFVKEWKLGDFDNDLNFRRASRDLKNGRKMYSAGGCVLCHQLGGTGRVFGPDLSNVSGRFSRRDVLEAILAPSKVVSEKYRNVTIETTDGESHTGQVVMEGDYRKSNLKLVTNPFEPDEVLEIPKIKIAGKRESEVSAMPEGLLNTLSREEILDLLAFIEAGGRGGD